MKNKFNAEYEKYKNNASEKDFEKIYQNEEKILNKASKQSLLKYFEQIKIMISMVKDYARGNYKVIPVSTILGIAGSLIYVFSPIDAIPDFIPLAGLIDDAGVIAVCLSLLNSDIERYTEWKNKTV